MEERQPHWDATQTRILDAADALIERRGVHGVTIAELARRADLSRPTIYRNWSDADDVVRAALLRRVDGILGTFPAEARTRTVLVDDVLHFTTLFRNDTLYGRLLADEPEAFTRYTLQRVGSSQRLILDWLATAIGTAQADGSVRSGPPQEIAVMLLLIAQSAVLSHGTVADLISENAWERELRAALDGLLRP
ncbi:MULTISPECIES: TetR/AcrR family transcriptional regulator [unclassified Microbacterium]|uniref:TetR/AcrR family transcriptional regulator n=1 Tax=unclassified Microbacterium TaxID=2609290 RepID=UPI0004936F34|nr:MULTISPECIES: TetR/AcrR family transcriptional regulator [unclassified Microbacterium]MCV0333759.1 TetR/AcrR family transcriptional regulator [Microbacterium sp.]MCV0375038.1 TetR/AcrR family transcriptional regulator [Microbacterium sp.]MCV0388442.1 TetR/AcrR family transcriptional regulator [Microbacterium sp.]MCV0416969.1 TetR/AcrR family transcriptional regulator [Microbacterium sp.]MCV0420280.1 TetR/AcrR family transcriptional regulator [Microbacterium sp.]